jgi:hypothetical protein
MRKALLGVALALWAAPAAHAAAPTRILYASDWSGPTQIFAADPATGKTVGQLTFGRPASTCGLAIACGFTDPLPSPNGKKIAYLETPLKAFDSPWILWIADADGRKARRVAQTSTPLGPNYAKRFTYAMWSPNSKELAYRSGPRGVSFVRLDGRPAGGHWFQAWPEGDVVLSPDRHWVARVEENRLVVTNRRSGSMRVLLNKHVFSLAWSPDSRAIAYVEGRMSDTTAASGDVGVVTLAGRERIVISGHGQVESVAWTRKPSTARYRPPEDHGGVFAGGPVAHLAADGHTVAFATCLDVHTWSPPRGNVEEIAARPTWLGSSCLAPDQRDEIYDLAVAGDRVAWGLKTSGLVFHWWLYQASGGSQFELATGSNALGSNWYGAGGLTGSGGSLIYSSWTTNPSTSDGFPVTSMTLFRTTAQGCPCTAIGYAAERQAFHGTGVTPLAALDTDGAHIAALRYDNLVLLDTSGADVATLGVRAAGAQLLGDEVVVLVPNELRVYSTSGALRRSWTIPTTSVGRDCRYYSEPHCPWQVELTLQDAARGLAAYVFDGEVHVLRLADGRDALVGHGTEARFMDDGLVYADGARVRLVPWASLR